MGGIKKLYSTFDQLLTVSKPLRRALSRLAEAYMYVQAVGVASS